MDVFNVGDGIDGFIDIPVVEAIEYFTRVMSFFGSIIIHLGQIIGLIGIVWTGLKIAMSRQQIKEGIFGLGLKWVAFFILVSFYSPACKGVAYIANRLAVTASGGNKIIPQNLASLRTNIAADLANYSEFKKNVSQDINSICSNLKLTSITDANESADYTSYLNGVASSILDSKSTDEQKRLALEKVNKYRTNHPDTNTIYTARTLGVLNSLLVEEDDDDTESSPKKNLLDSFLPKTIWLQNRSDTPYLSPSSIFRIALFCASVMWENFQAEYNSNINEIDNTDYDSTKILGYSVSWNFVQRPMHKVEYTIQKIPQFVLLIFSIIVLILCVIFAIIQYVMTIIEYTIVTGIGVVLIPFILFDGTKEMPKKLIPVITGFLMKMMVITICMFFMLYLMMDFTLQQITSTSGVNVVSFGNILFISIICFVLCQNAPKIAQTILTGQPQLSMGEFAAAATTGSMVGMGMGKISSAGIRTGTNTAINTAGALNKIGQTTTNATATAYSETNGSKGKKILAGALGGATGLRNGIRDSLGNGLRSMGRSMAEKGNAYLHGKTSPGPLGKMFGQGGAGGGGTGAGARPDNPSGLFHGAKNMEGKNMGVMEYIKGDGKAAEKGKNIGSEIAKVMNVKTNAPASDSNILPENLTGSERQYDPTE